MTHGELLRALHRASPAMRKSILKGADAGLIRNLVEITHNVIRGNVKLSKAQKSKLSRHKRVLRKIVKRGENWKSKKKVLLQKGGGILPLLLGPLLGSVLGSLFK